MSTNQVYHDSQHHLVLSTQNYEKFKFDPRNRPIDQDRLAVLYDSVAKKNLLHLFPIIVTPDWVVFDGQHRLKVAEALGAPIYYMFDKDVSIEYIVMTTDAVTKWTNENYLHRWCAEGKADYLELQKFWFTNRSYKSRTFLTLGHSTNLCYFGDRNGMNLDFRNGKYTCNDMLFAESVAQALKDWSIYVDFYNQTAFIYAISNLMANAEYDHQRMMDKMQYLSTRIVKCADTASYIAMMNPVYNHKVIEKNRVTLRKLNSSDRNWRTDRRRPLAA